MLLTIWISFRGAGQAEAAQRLDDLLGAGPLPIPARPEVIGLESFERAVLSV
jgi:hypothetical protein